MASNLVTLYDALTGNSTVAEAGFGYGPSRMKAWMDEVPRFLKLAAEPVDLKGLGIARLANFPTWVAGEGTPAAAAFNGVSLWRVVQCTAVLAMGDGVAVAFGASAPTNPNPELDEDWLRADGNPANDLAPAGAQHVAYLQTNDLTTLAPDLSPAGANVLTLDVNGTRYAVTIAAANLAAVLPGEIQESIVQAGVPVMVVNATVDAQTRLRILAPGEGITSNIRVVAGGAAALLFGAAKASAVGTMYRGGNGPLGVMDNTEVVEGRKPQRRILPQSVQVIATIAAATVTLTDDGAGVLSDISGAHVGTINYATGAITLTFGVVPDNNTPVSVSWKALKALNLSDPVRLTPGGIEIAITLN